MLLRRSALLAVLSLVLLPAAPLRADDEDTAPPPGETLPERTLRDIVQRQQTILNGAARNKNLDQEALRSQLQGICHEYELLLRDSPKFELGWAAYGRLLFLVDMDKEALAVLLKADQIDPKDPLVKNEIGNCLAETGKPLEAALYFRAAIRLDPNNPLFHYQLGTLLYEARGEFVQSGEWTRDQISQAAHDAFKRAAELAPDRVEFTYRYAESFKDLKKPDWDEALKLWGQLEEKAETPMERETMRLQAADDLIRAGRFDQARAVLASVDLPALDPQKQKLVAELPPPPKH